MRSTKRVVDNHPKCFGEGDLEGILSAYAPGAVLCTPQAPPKGIDEIRALLEAVLAEFAKPGSAFSLERLSTNPYLAD